jgi:hypothetical protein
VFAIGLGSNVDREGLTALAEASGGEAHFPDDIAALQEDYTRVVEALRRRYVIGYTSTNGARDGAWRKVEIRCRIPSVNVMSRGGYSAPEK